MLQQSSGGKRRKTLDKMAVVRGRGEKGASWKVLENAGETRTYEECGGVSLVKERSKVKKFREDAEKEKQEGIQDQ